jgi:hypothetical protein
VTLAVLVDLPGIAVRTPFVAGPAVGSFT